MVNVIKTRIFPLPLNKSRMVKVSYVEDLSTTDNEASYSLPLSFPSAIPSFEMNVTCDGTNIGIPDLNFDGNVFKLTSGLKTNKSNVFAKYVSTLTHTQENKHFFWNHQGKNQVISRGFSVVIPKFSQKLIVEKDEEGQASNITHKILISSSFLQSMML